MAAGSNGGCCDGLTGESKLYTHWNLGPSMLFL